MFKQEKGHVIKSSSRYDLRDAALCVFVALRIHTPIINYIMQYMHSLKALLTYKCATRYFSFIDIFRNRTQNCIQCLTRRYKTSLVQSDIDVVHRRTSRTQFCGEAATLVAARSLVLCLIKKARQRQQVFFPVVGSSSWFLCFVSS